MNKDVAGYIQRLESENAALREKLRLADELASAIGSGCSDWTVKQALAAYRAAQKSEASHAK